MVAPLVADRYTEMSCPTTLQLACLCSILLVALGSLFMGLLSPSWIICALLGIRSMGRSVVWIDSSLRLQKFSDPEMPGRVSAAELSLPTLAESLSAAWQLVYYRMTEATMPRVSLMLGGIGLLLWAGWMHYHNGGGGASSYIDEESSNSSAESTGTQTPTETSLIISDEEM